MRTKIYVRALVTFLNSSQYQYVFLRYITGKNSFSVESCIYEVNNNIDALVHYITLLFKLLENMKLFYVIVEAKKKKL